MIFIEIVNGQCTYTLGPDLSSAPSWGNPCLNGLAVNDQNEMFISAPGSGPFNIYQVNKTTGAIIKFVGAIPNPVPTSMGNVMLNWVNRLKCKFVRGATRGLCPSVWLTARTRASQPERSQPGLGLGLPLQRRAWRRRSRQRLSHIHADEQRRPERLCILRH